MNLNYLSYIDYIHKEYLPPRLIYMVDLHLYILQ